jgi:hypothetical protein
MILWCEIRLELGIGSNIQLLPRVLRVTVATHSLFFILNFAATLILRSIFCPLHNLRETCLMDQDRVNGKTKKSAFLHPSSYLETEHAITTTKQNRNVGAPIYYTASESSFMLNIHLFFELRAHFFDSHSESPFEDGNYTWKYLQIFHLQDAWPINRRCKTSRFILAGNTSYQTWTESRTKRICNIEICTYFYLLS